MPERAWLLTCASLSYAVAFDVKKKKQRFLWSRAKVHEPFGGEEASPFYPPFSLIRMALAFDFFQETSFGEPRGQA